MLRKLGAIVLIAFMGACTREQATKTASSVSQTTRKIGNKVKETFDTSVPVGREPAPTQQELDRERFNDSWRKLQSFQAAKQRAAAAAVAANQAKQAQAAAGGLSIVTVPKFDETLTAIDPATIDHLPIHVPITGDVGGPSVLRAQVLLDRSNFKPGMIDGRWGKNSEIAVYWFQRQYGLNPTGAVDADTFRALLQKAGATTAITRYTLTTDDVKGPFTKLPDDVYQQEKLDCLCYQSITEELTERFHLTAGLLAQLNPGVNLDSLQAGAQINALNVPAPLTDDRDAGIAKIIVSVGGNYLHALDGNGTIILHAPTTVGDKYDPSPDETLHITGISFLPNFHYQPALFHEKDPNDPEAHLQPGPNSPVGLVWMALSKEHFGIHGTESPETIGYASSHGCIRLANWDAVDLAHQVKVGTLVEFVDTKAKEQ